MDTELRESALWAHCSEHFLKVARECPCFHASGNETWISGERGVDFDILKSSVIFKSKAPADS